MRNHRNTDLFLHLVQIIIGSFGYVRSRNSPRAWWPLPDAVQRSTAGHSLISALCRLSLLSIIQLQNVLVSPCF